MSVIEVHEKHRVYETVVYMAWGDQQLAPAEISAARAIAEELQLDAEAGLAQALLRAGPRALADVGLSSLSPRGRRVAYATAAWVAFCDGREHPAERAILETLRYRMGLDPDTATLLEWSALLVVAHASQSSPRARYRALLRSIEHVVTDAWRVPGTSLGGG